MESITSGIRPRYPARTREPLMKSERIHSSGMMLRPEGICSLVTILICLGIARYTGVLMLPGFIGIFFIIGIFHFPSGPLSLPHPVFWRVVFGVSVLHLVIVVTALCLPYDVVRAQIIRLDPAIDNADANVIEQEEDCDPLTLLRVWDSVRDPYGWAHIINCMWATMFVRHASLMCATSILWEAVERVFAPAYPFMWECWWNSVITDIIVCNGAGITLGVILYRRLGWEEHHWHRNRANKPWVAVFHVMAMILYLHFLQWNSLALAETFHIPEFHRFVLCRLYANSIASMLACRDYYLYAIDYERYRQAAQNRVLQLTWFVEILICLKFGYTKFMALNVVHLMTLAMGYVMFAAALVGLGRYLDGGITPDDKTR